MLADSLLADALLAGPAIGRWMDVAAAWLLTYLVHSTLVLLGVWALTSWVALRDGTRDILWKTALVGGLVTASVQTAVAREPLGGQFRLSSRTAHGVPPAVRIAVREEGPGARSRVLVRRSNGTQWTAAVVALWLTGAGAALLWLTAAHGRASRALGDRASLDGTPISRRMRDLLDRAGERRSVKLTCSTATASPVALPGREVCLPRRALVELEAVEQESMLAHEIAHIVRRDPGWLIAARVIEALLFVQPLNRLARRRMQEVAEFLCDDWAIQRTSQPIVLAKCLAAVAEWVGRAPRLHPMSAMVEPGGSPLVRRVGRILGDGAAHRASSSRGALGTSLCGLIVLAAVAPRVSVARSEVFDRTVMFARAIVVRDGTTAPREMLVFRRLETESAARDSLRAGVMWRRPFPPSAGGTAGARAPVASGERVETTVVVRRR
jgi:beta-lactamase regulating signal transducer with metallopeptidase domain